MKNRLLFLLFALACMLGVTSEVCAQDAPQWDTELITNGSLTSGLDDWNGPTNDGYEWAASNGWAIATYNTSSIYQTIDLSTKGFEAGMVDNKAVSLAVTYKIPWAGTYHTGICHVFVHYLDNSSATLATDTLVWRDLTNQEEDSTAVTKESVIPVGTTSIKYELVGRDQKNWDGCYGPMFTGMSVMIHQGSFLSVNYTNGTYRWIPTTADVKAGCTPGLMSNNKEVGNSSSTTTLTIASSDSIYLSFDWTVSSEPTYDKLTITANGTNVVNAVSGLSSGHQDLAYEAGSVVLALTYSKDGSVNKNDDRAYIYNILVNGQSILPLYGVSIASAEHISVTADKTEACEGELITLTPSTGRGYQWASYTASPEVTWTGDHTFVMPGQNVTITPSAQEGAISHTVTTGTSDAGSFVATPTEAYEGDTVVLYAYPNQGYRFCGWTSDPAVVTVVHRMQFLMPDADVTLTPDWRVIRTLTVGEHLFGTLQANYDYPVEGDTIVLHAEALEGCAFVGWTASEEVVRLSDTTFLMPASDLVITPLFRSVTPHDITVSAVHGSYTLSATSALWGDTISVTFTPDAGYELDSWSTSPSIEPLDATSFVMPNEAVTITATFSRNTYAVTLAPVSHCQLAASAASAGLGDTIVLSVALDPYYVLDSISASPAVTWLTDTTFLMPAGAVSLTATVHYDAVAPIRSVIYCSEAVSLTATVNQYPWTPITSDVKPAYMPGLMPSNWNLHSTTSADTLRFSCDEEYTISLSWKVSSEARYDWLYIYLDGEEKVKMSGLENGTLLCPVSAGSHTLQFSYSKDHSANSNDDRAYIYNLCAFTDDDKPHYSITSDTINGYYMVASRNGVPVTEAHIYDTVTVSVVDLGTNTTNQRYGDAYYLNGNQQSNFSFVMPYGNIRLAPVMESPHAIVSDTVSGFYFQTIYHGQPVTELYPRDTFVVRVVNTGIAPTARCSGFPYINGMARLNDSTRVMVDWDITLRPVVLFPHTIVADTVDGYYLTFSQTTAYQGDTIRFSSNETDDVLLTYQYTVAYDWLGETIFRMPDEDMTFSLSVAHILPIDSILPEGFSYSLTSREGYPWIPTTKAIMKQANKDLSCGWMSNNCNIDYSNSISTLTVTGNRSFKLLGQYLVSSEGCSDKLYFDVDGQHILNPACDGKTGSFESESGFAHTLYMDYSKDGTVSHNLDRAFVYGLQVELAPDNILYPACDNITVLGPRGAFPGDTVRLSSKVDRGFRLDAYSVSPEVTMVGADAFIMPDDTVSVTATVVAVDLHSVQVDAVEGAVITPNMTQAYLNDTIILSGSFDDAFGYITGFTTTPETEHLNAFSFVMPEEDVVVNPTIGVYQHGSLVIPTVEHATLTITVNGQPATEGMTVKQSDVVVITYHVDDDCYLVSGDSVQTIRLDDHFANGQCILPTQTVKVNNPTNLEVFSVDSTTIEVSWHSGSETVLLAVVPAADYMASMMSGFDFTPVSDSSAMISGLEFGETYYVVVANPDYSSPFDFATAQHALTYLYDKDASCVVDIVFHSRGWWGWQGAYLELYDGQRYLGTAAGNMMGGSVTVGVNDELRVFWHHANGDQSTANGSYFEIYAGETFITASEDYYCREGQLVYSGMPCAQCANIFGEFETFNSETNTVTFSINREEGEAEPQVQAIIATHPISDPADYMDEAITFTGSYDLVLQPGYRYYAFFRIVCGEGVYGAWDYYEVYHSLDVEDLSQLITQPIDFPFHTVLNDIDTLQLVEGVPSVTYTFSLSDTTVLYAAGIAPSNHSWVSVQKADSAGQYHFLNIMDPEMPDYYLATPGDYMVNVTTESEPMEILIDTLSETCYTISPDTVLDFSLDNNIYYKIDNRFYSIFDVAILADSAVVDMALSADTLADRIFFMESDARLENDLPIDSARHVYVAAPLEAVDHLQLAVASDLFSMEPILIGVDTTVTVHPDGYARYGRDYYPGRVYSFTVDTTILAFSLDYDEDIDPALTLCYGADSVICVLDEEDVHIGMMLNAGTYYIYAAALDSMADFRFSIRTLQMDPTALTGDTISLNHKYDFRLDNYESQVYQYLRATVNYEMHTVYLTKGHTYYAWLYNYEQTSPEAFTAVFLPEQQHADSVLKLLDLTSDELGKGETMTLSFTPDSTGYYSYLVGYVVERELDEAFHGSFEIGEILSLYGISQAAPEAVTPFRKEDTPYLHGYRSETYSFLTGQFQADGQDVCAYSITLQPGDSILIDYSLTGGNVMMASAMLQIYDKRSILSDAPIADITDDDIITIQPEVPTYYAPADDDYELIIVDVFNPDPVFSASAWSRQLKSTFVCHDTVAREYLIIGSCQMAAYEHPSHNIRIINLLTDADTVYVSGAADRQVVYAQERTAASVAEALAAVTLTLVDEQGATVDTIANTARRWIINLEKGVAVYAVRRDEAPFGYQLAETGRQITVTFSTITYVTPAISAEEVEVIELTEANVRSALSTLRITAQTAEGDVVMTLAGSDAAWTIDLAAATASVTLTDADLPDGYTFGQNPTFTVSIVEKSAIDYISGSDSADALRAEKFYRDGHIFIRLSSGRVYDSTGRLVK